MFSHKVKLMNFNYKYLMNVITAYKQVPSCKYDLISQDFNYGSVKDVIVADCTIEKRHVQADKDRWSG